MPLDHHAIYWPVAPSTTNQRVTHYFITFNILQESGLSVAQRKVFLLCSWLFSEQLFHSSQAHTMSYRTRATGSSQKPTPNQAQSKLNDLFLTGCTQTQPRKPLSFFQDLHQDVLKSWKQPFSAHVMNPVSTGFATVSNIAEHGCATMPVVEETLAPHLMPNSAPA